jgi:hypothetical protein
MRGEDEEGKGTRKDEEEEEKEQRLINVEYISRKKIFPYQFPRYETL